VLRLDAETEGSLADYVRNREAIEQLLVAVEDFEPTVRAICPACARYYEGDDLAAFWDSRFQTSSCITASRGPGSNAPTSGCTYHARVPILAAGFHLFR
jgi:hypothetical protein